jgi:hypothetical protein
MQTIKLVIIIIVWCFGSTLSSNTKISLSRHVALIESPILDNALRVASLNGADPLSILVFNTDPHPCYDFRHKTWRLKDSTHFSPPPSLAGTATRRLHARVVKKLSTIYTRIYINIKIISKAMGDRAALQYQWIFLGEATMHTFCWQKDTRVKVSFVPKVRREGLVMPGEPIFGMTIEKQLLINEHRRPIFVFDFVCSGVVSTVSKGDAIYKYIVFSSSTCKCGMIRTLEQPFYNPLWLRDLFVANGHKFRTPLTPEFCSILLQSQHSNFTHKEGFQIVSDLFSHASIQRVEIPINSVIVFSAFKVETASQQISYFGECSKILEWYLLNGSVEEFYLLKGEECVCVVQENALLISNVGVVTDAPIVLDFFMLEIEKRAREPVVDYLRRALMPFQVVQMGAWIAFNALQFVTGKVREKWELAIGHWEPIAAAINEENAIGTMTSMVIVVLEDSFVQQNSLIVVNVTDSPLDLAASIITAKHSGIYQVHQQHGPRIFGLLSSS